jgi:hypothetical protein
VRRHRRRSAAAQLRVDEDGARLAEGEVQALHGPHYESPQDGETTHARCNRASRVRKREHRARAHMSCRAVSDQRDAASSALPRVAHHPLRSDVQLAERRLRNADALRDECRQ